MSKFLVIDDTKNIRMLLKTCLEIEGHDVYIASDGHEALDLMSSDKFDLIFMDIKMPKISGTEVLRKMRDLGISTPVIIMTAFGTVKNAVECTKLGAISYLQKPFTSEKVKNVLKETGFSNVIQEKDNVSKFVEIEASLKQDHYTQALELIKEELSKDPLNPKIYKLLSKACLGLGNKNESIAFEELYQKLIK